MENSPCQAVFGYVPEDLLWVVIVDLQLPGLIDVIDYFRGSIGLEKLRIVRGLGNEIAQTIESCDDLAFAGVRCLEGACDVTKLIT